MLCTKLYANRYAGRRGATAPPPGALRTGRATIRGQAAASRLYPAPTFTLWPALLAIDVVYKALAQALPDRVPASSGGDVISTRSGGGGGWGDPLQRDPEAVRRDVRDGYVSVESARDDYGVALDDRLRVDEEATRDLRS